MGYADWHGQILAGFSRACDPRAAMQDGFRADATIDGHELAGDSGKRVSRGFCPSCGSRLFNAIAARPEIVAILAGSLDDPSIYKPIVDIYTSSAQPWDHMDPQTVKFLKMPE